MCAETDLDCWSTSKRLLDPVNICIHEHDLSTEIAIQCLSKILAIRLILIRIHTNNMESGLPLFRASSHFATCPMSPTAADLDARV